MDAIEDADPSDPASLEAASALMPPQLVREHLMHVTGWPYEHFRNTPRIVLQRYLLVMGVQNEKDRDRMEMARMSKGV